MGLYGMKIRIVIQQKIYIFMYIYSYLPIQLDSQML